MNEYVVAVDIAKKRDFTSIFIIKQTPEIVSGSETMGSPDRIIRYADIVHMDKFNNMPYPDLVSVIAERMGHRDLMNNADLLVDGTGIGEAVVDLLRERMLSPIPIIFTGGQKVSEVYHEFGAVFTTGKKLQGARMLKELHVPKADLVDAGRIMMQQHRVRVAPGLKWADDFQKQLVAFRGKVNEKGGIKYEADTEGDHDDMVVCYLIGAWWIVRHTGAAEIKEKRIVKQAEGKDWSPADFF